MKLMYLQQIGVNTRYYVVTIGVLVWMKVLQECIAMDLVAPNIISILALMFFPMKTKGENFVVFLLHILLNWIMFQGRFYVLIQFKA